MTAAMYRSLASSHLRIAAVYTKEAEALDALKKPRRKAVKKAVKKRVLKK